MSEHTAATRPQKIVDTQNISARPGLLQRKCACGGGAAGLTGKCEECEGQGLTVQRRAAGHSEIDSVPPIVGEVLRSSGQPLGAETRALMESRFGHNFGRVRVHTDARAGESARAVDALAYTVGHDVVFGPGQYAPHTAAGRKLVAHELAHVVQQGGSHGSSELAVGAPDSAAEREADAVAEGIGAAHAGAHKHTLRADAGPPTLRRAPCLPATDAKCTGGAKGSPEQFSKDVGKKAKPLESKYGSMTTKQAEAAGHGVEAKEVEKFLDEQRPGLRNRVHGIFVSKTIVKEDVAAEHAFKCAGSVPSITDPAILHCVLVPDNLEREAKVFNTKKTEKKVGELDREDWRVNALKTLVHETQHANYDEYALQNISPPAGVACSRVEVIGELSEISAEISEFPVVFRAMPADAQAKATAQKPDFNELRKYPEFNRLVDWFIGIQTGGESIIGSLTAMRCKCSCSDVDTYAIETFNVTAASWSTAEKQFFTKLMHSPSQDFPDPKWPIKESDFQATGSAMLPDTASKCDRLCQSLDSMRNSANHICDLAGSEKDAQCIKARKSVAESEKKIADASCTCPLKAM